jgi:hypothetical protein
MTGKLMISVTFDEARGGYIGTCPELSQQPVVALSLGGLRRRIEQLLFPDDDVIVMLHLDKLARRERDQRRRGGVAGVWPR